MIRKIYETQKQIPSVGDFYEIVKNDMSVVGINLSEEQISKMKKQQFKKIVLTHVRTAALNYLKQLQEKHSKLDGIKYDKLELQNYLTSPLFNNESRNLLCVKCQNI